MPTRDEIIDSLLPLTTTISPEDIDRKIIKLQRLQTLLRQYEELKQHQKADELLGHEEQRNKELKYILKELKYNLDPNNKDPPVDLGNGKELVTIWKAPPDDT